MKTPYIAKRIVRMYEKVFGPAPELANAWSSAPAIWPSE